MKQVFRAAADRPAVVSLQCRSCSDTTCAEFELVSLFAGSGYLANVFAACTGLQCDRDDGLPPALCAACNAQLIAFNKFRRMANDCDANYRAQLKTDICYNYKGEAQTSKAANVNDAHSSVEDAAVSIYMETVSIDEERQSIAADVADESVSIVDESELLANESVSIAGETLSMSGDAVSIVDGHIDFEAAELDAVDDEPDEVEMVECDEFVDEVDDGSDDPDYVACDDAESTDDQKPPAEKTEITYYTEIECTEDRRPQLRPGFPHSIQLVPDEQVDDDQRSTLTAKLETIVFGCDECPSRFYKQHRLEMHKKTMHNGEAKRFGCDACSKSFATERRLEAHQRTCAGGQMTDAQAQAGDETDGNPALGGRFVCDQCGKRFVTNGSLKKHSFVHGGDMPFACTLCPRRYVTKHKLKEHVMRHEGIRNHVCPHCGIRKTTANELKVHINFHTREKIWQCDQCPLTFSNVGNYTRHVKVVHCGLRPFSCTMCDRSFGKAATLKHHQMTHTGEKPHGCEVCGKRFIQLVALRVHLRTHQRDRDNDEEDQGPAEES